MVHEIHVLPIGFDISRLTTPLTAKGSEYEPDEVILLYSANDAIEEDTNKLSTSERLVKNAFEEIKRTLEDQLQVPTEIRKLPDLNDYLGVYETAYRLLDDLSESNSDTETEREVHVNISALPKAAALAISNAATALINETPSKGSHVYIYYVPPEEYLEAQLIEFLEGMQPAIEEILTFGDLWWSFEDQLFETLSGSLNYILKDLEAAINKASQQLAAAEPAEREDHWEDQIEVALERTTDLQEYVSYKWVIREEGHDRGPYPSLLLDKYFRRDVEEEISGVIGHLEDIKTAIREADQGAVADTVINQIGTTLDILEETLPGCAELEWWSTRYPTASEELGGVLWDARDHLEEIERYGMTRGLGKTGDKIQTPISVPPVASLRDMERLVLYVLEDEGTVDSMGALAQQIATSLRQHLESFRIDGAPTSDTVPEFVDQIAARIEGNDEDDVLAALESEMADRIRSRLQYNIDSLEEKQYVRRSKGKDSRRAQISLTDTGKQWTRTHDIPAVSRDPMEKVLSKEIEKFVADNPA